MIYHTGEEALEPRGGRLAGALVGEHLLQLGVDLFYVLILYICFPDTRSEDHEPVHPRESTFERRSCAQTCPRVTRQSRAREGQDSSQSRVKRHQS
jgi:hypothetical protein